MCDSEYYGSREKEMKKLLANNWYRQWSDSLTFSLYDDGTVNVPGSYGLGKWSLVNDNQLILSDFYGETITLKIETIDDQWLVVYDMENGKQVKNQSHSGTQRKAHRRSVLKF